MAISVRIHRPAKTAMQSGYGNSRRWLLEFGPQAAGSIGPLMGWTSSRDTRQQVKLWFASKEEAVAYAKQQGYDYRVDEPKERRVKPKAYADNFAYSKVSEPYKSKHNV